MSDEYQLDPGQDPPFPITANIKTGQHHDSDSDNSSLEPPFEIHGIQPNTNIQPTQERIIDIPEQPIIQEIPAGIRIEQETDDDESDEDVPASLQFELKQQVQDNDMLLPKLSPKLGTIPQGLVYPPSNRRTESPSDLRPPTITAWKHVYHMDEFLCRVRRILLELDRFTSFTKERDIGAF